MNAEVLTSKVDEIRNGTMRWWGKRSNGNHRQMAAGVDRLLEQWQKRYGYTRDRAELELGRFLDRYDQGVHEVVQSLPGNLDRRVSRYPWAAMATALGLGLLMGFAIKPRR